MSTEDLIASLQGGLRVDSEGSFTLHREKAREKLRTFQVAEPQKYVLHLIALASLKQATKVHVRVDSDDVVVRFDGEPVTAEDLDDLYGSSFAAARTDAQRARQQLAVGIHAAMALNPRWVRVTSGTGDAAVSMTVRHGAADEIGGAFKGAPRGTQIHVKQRFRPGLMIRFVQQVRGALAEMTWLRERCRFSTLAIVLNDEQITRGMALGGVAHGFSARDGATHGVAGLEKRPLPAVVRLVRHGVWLHDVPAPHLPLGFTAVIRDDGLLTDLSGDKVVQDEQHARCVRLAERLAASVIAAVVGPHEGGVTPPVGERLQPVWHGWPAALQADTPVGAAMGRIVRWSDIFGRRHSLATLHAVRARLGHVPVAWGKWDDRVPVVDDIIVQRVLTAPPEPNDELIARALGAAMLDVTAELEQRALAEQHKRRWRAQPSESTLNQAHYHLTAPFSVTLAGVTVQGHVGVRRVVTSTCSLFVVVDGCLLAELEMAAPIPGVDVLLAGPLPIRDDFTGPVHGDLLAACVGAWVATSRVLADIALRRGLVLEASPARPGFVHGFLRSYHRGEALRATLVAAGFPHERLADHMRHLMRSLPPHPVPGDLHAQPWLRGMYAFMTAGGERLEAADIGRLLADEVAVRWISDSVAGHPLIREPVLRLATRECEALRWLFGGKIPRIKPEEYAVLLARAEFRERPEATDVLSEETCTPHVTVEHEGLRIGAAFVLAAEVSSTGSSRRHSQCEVIVEGRRLCKVWFQAPIDRLHFAAVGEGLTIAPTWDGIAQDDAFYAAEQAAVRAVPGLVRAAVAALPGESDGEVSAAWRAGIVAALTATFPTPAFRTAFATLVAEHGRREAEARYLRVLALTQVTSPADMFPWIAAHATEARSIGDVAAVAEALKVATRPQAVVDELGAALAGLREALGQVGGSSWLEDVGRCAPEVAALPLLRRVDGELVSLGQVHAQMEGLAIHVVVHPDDCAWPHEGRKTRLAEESTRLVLRSLFDETDLRVPNLQERPSGGGSPADLLQVMRDLRRRMTASQAVADALPLLLAKAIAAGRRDDEEGRAWRKGLVLALGATFPAPVLRRLFAELAPVHGAAAEKVYCTALLRAQQIGVDGLAMELEEALARPKVRAGDRRAALLQRVLAELRKALGQVYGATLLESVAQYSPEVGVLPLFVRIDGTPVTLAEVAVEATNGVIHVFAGADMQERPRAYLRSLRVDEDTIDVLCGLYGPDRVSTVAPPRPPGEEGSSLRDSLGKPLNSELQPLQPEWLTTLKQAQQAEADAPTRLPTRGELKAKARDAAKEQEEDVARLHGELRPLSGPTRAAGVKTFEPPKPREPTPAERMVAAIQGELHALRRGHEALLTGFNLDHVRAVPGDGVRAVRCDKDGVVLDPNHPRIAAAVASYGGDRVWICFLVSQVYTALNVWREDITDADEEAFHRRHLGWLRGELVRERG